MLTPNRDVRAVAQAYNAARGLGVIVEGHYAAVDETRARAIAREYEQLPTRGDADAWRSYVALAGEVTAQYLWLCGSGYSFTFTEADPYPDSASMMADLALHKRIRVFSGGEPHPFLTARENEWFRAVHDVFGHAAEGYQFGPRGEENAWIHHSQMLTPLAQAALTSETRGQNCWVNFGPHAGLPVRERPFAPQKAALLPAWACDFRLALGVSE